MWCYLLSLHWHVLSRNATGQNSIIVVNGANDLLTVDEVMAARPLLASAKVLLCQLEIKREVRLRLLGYQ